MKRGRMTLILLGLCAGLTAVAGAQIPEVSSEVAAVGIAVSAGQGEVPEGGRPRDPFWPVGYIPKKVKIAPELKSEAGKPVAGFVEPSQGAAQVPLWDEARKKVDMRGISQIHDKNTGTPKYLAVVAGRVVEPGDVVSVKYIGRLYRWRVTDISEEGVSLQKLDVRGD